MHHHSHGSHVHKQEYTSTFKIGIFLNFAYVLIEALVGTWIHSSALVSDALHNLSDVTSMLLSWAAFSLASKNHSEKFTFGYGKATILAAFINGILLLLAAAGIAYDIYSHWGIHLKIPGMEVVVVSGIGIVVNAYTAWLFFQSKKDLNMKGNFLHMAADALVSLGVMLSGIAIFYTGLDWIDTAMSLIILVIILYSTWHLLKEAGEQLMDKVPDTVDILKINSFLDRHPAIDSYHDLHVWSLTTEQVALIAHVLFKKGVPVNAALDEIHEELKHHFGITQITIQTEQIEESHIHPH
jgi:cobalt-zinc-cadmium efflux system protein